MFPKSPPFAARPPLQVARSRQPVQTFVQPQSCLQIPPSLGQICDNISRLKVGPELFSKVQKLRVQLDRITYHDLDREAGHSITKRKTYPILLTQLKQVFGAMEDPYLRLHQPVAEDLPLVATDTHRAYLHDEIRASFAAMSEDKRVIFASLLTPEVQDMLGLKLVRQDVCIELRKAFDQVHPEGGHYLSLEEAAALVDFLRTNTGTAAFINGGAVLADYWGIHKFDDMASGASVPLRAALEKLEKHPAFVHCGGRYVDASGNANASHVLTLEDERRDCGDESGGIKLPHALLVKPKHSGKVGVDDIGDKPLFAQQAIKTSLFQPPEKMDTNEMLLRPESLLRTGQATVGILDVPHKLDEGDLGEVIGAGGMKEVRRVSGFPDLVAAICASDIEGYSLPPVEAHACLVIEALNRKKASDLGLPVVACHGIADVQCTFSTKPALIMDHIEGSRSSKGGRDDVPGQSDIPATPNLNKKSIAQLQHIRDTLVAAKLAIDDLQLLVDAEGNVLIHDDPALLENHPEVAQANIALLDRMIELARDAAGSDGKEIN